MPNESDDELKQKLDNLERAAKEWSERGKALHESDELYRRLIELSFDGIGIYTDGKIVFINDKGAAILGADSPEQIVGRDVTDFVHPDSLESMLRIFTRVYDKNEYLILDEELLTRIDGSVIDVEVSGIPITWESKPAGLTVFRDITERKRQERRAGDAFSDLQEMFNAIPDAVVYADTERRIIRINPGFTKMFGYELAEVYGKNTAFMYQDDTMYRDMGNKRFNPYAPVEAEYYEVKYRRRDGGVFVSETLGTKVRNADGVVIGYLAIIRDITEKRVMEEKLRESEELHRITIESISDAVFITDDDGNFTYICPNAKHIFGYSFDEIQAFGAIRRLLGEDIFDPGDLKALGELRNIERDITDKFGSVRTVLVNAKTISIKDGTIVYTCREITERKKALGELEQTARQLESILDSISDGFFVLDDDLVFTYFNRASEQLLNRKRDDVIGLTLTEAFPETADSVFETKYREALRDRNPMTFETYFDIPPYINWFDVRVFPGENGLTVFFQLTTERHMVQKALLESEERYRTLVANLPGAMYRSLTDDNRTIEFISDGIEKLTGYPAEDFIRGAKRHLRDIIHQDDRKNVFGKKPSDNNSGAQNHDEYRIVRADGGIRWLHDRWSIVFDEAAKQEYRNGIILDISKRKNAEQALIVSRERLDLAMSAANIGLWDWTFGIEKIITNEQYYTMLGYQPFEFDLTFETWKNSLHPDDYGRSVEILDKYIRGETDVYENEFRMQTKTGSWIWVNSRGRIISWDKDGKSARMMGIHADVTERHHAEQKILDIARFPEENPSPVLRIGSDGQLIYINRASLALLDVWQCSPGGTVPADIARHVVDALASGTASKIDVEAGERILSLIFAPVTGMNYVNIYGHDITSERRAEEARHKLEAQIQHTQKLESLGVLAGGIAHDFNNILVGILGNADLALLEMSSVSPARETVEEIKKAAIRASELTNQMLAYSGKGRFLIEPIFINELIVEMGHMLKLTISKKASLKFDFAENLPPIEADAAQIRQIVMNLITNASDAIGGENGIITITTSPMDIDKEYLESFVADDRLPEGMYVSIEVSDTGCGMDRETIPKIFDPFFTTKFTGRGLGLSAVLGIVRGHKGAIKIYSEPGKGTTFRVLFPASKQTEVPKEKKSVERIQSPLGQGIVLVVDDEPSVRTVVKRMLEKAGFHVLTACDGREGLERFKEHADEICLVLLDMTMPRMNGEEVFREIKKIRDDIRVILSSGFNEQDATNRFAGKGLAGFIQKPFQFEKLLGKIREVMGSDG